MYRVKCVNCGAEFDAVAAEKCDCLEMMRSVRCPSCGACYCAREKAKKAFWDKAPSAMRERKAELSEPIPPETVRHPLLIFADDDPTSRAIMRRVAATLDVDLMMVANGAHLVEVVRRYRPEVVVTDALMPGMDGREASKIIKGEFPQTKVVVITSVYKGLRYKQEAMTEFGADDYLHKPISPEELGEAIRKMFQ